MKILSLRILLVFFVSLAFCNDDEKYSFIFGDRVVGEKHVQIMSQEISFTLPGIGHVEYVSGSTSVIEFSGIEGDFWKFRATLTDVENNNTINGIEILDQYRDAVEGSSCYLYVKRGGLDDEVHHIDPVNEEDYYLQEAFEAAHMNIYPNNFRYPFGIDAVDITKGDSWSLSRDSLKFYINIGSPSSMLSSKADLTLKKIKEKRGRKIAYINSISEVDADFRIAVNFLGERRFITGHATGTGSGKFQWDIESTEHLSQKLVLNCAGDFEIGGEKSFMKIFVRTINKKVE